MSKTKRANLGRSAVSRSVKRDADNPQLTEVQLGRLRRVAPIKRIRWQLGLSQEEFAGRFQIPIGTLRDWEQGRSEPDRPARAYLKVIDTDPAFVSRALGSESPSKTKSPAEAAKRLAASALSRATSSAPRASAGKGRAKRSS